MRVNVFFVPAALALLCLPAAAQKMAVVNVPAVSERYRKTADLEARFDGIRTKLRQDRDAMQDRLERSRRSLQEELKPGTDEFNERRKQIAILEAEIQWFVETEGQRIERGLAESLRGIFADVQAVVAEIAKEKSLDIVVAADQLPPEASDNPNQVKQHILLQKVLYWSPGVDITDEVIARLNSRYGNSPSKDSAAPVEKSPAANPGGKAPASKEGGARPGP